MTNPIETLKANLDKLSQSDRAFAHSLLAAAEGRGASAKQAYWIARLATRASGFREQPANIGNMEGLLAIFDRAAQHLKRPAIVANSPVGQIKLSVAGPRSREPGSINVAEKGRFGEAKFFGRIGRDGIFKPREEATPALIEYLKAFAADPARMAAEHGHQTGACCFCSRTLTDERSTSVGYGPICADAYGLPWGERPASVAGQAAA